MASDGRTASAARRWRSCDRIWSSSTSRISRGNGAVEFSGDAAGCESADAKSGISSMRSTRTKTQLETERNQAAPPPQPAKLRKRKHQTRIKAPHRRPLAGNERQGPRSGSRPRHRCRERSLAWRALWWGLTLRASVSCFGGAGRSGGAQQRAQHGHSRSKAPRSKIASAPRGEPPRHASQSRSVWFAISVLAIASQTDTSQIVATSIPENSVRHHSTTQTQTTTGSNQAHTTPQVTLPCKGIRFPDVISQTYERAGAQTNVPWIRLHDLGHTGVKSLLQ